MAKQIKLDPSVNGKGLTPSSERGAHMKRSMRDMVLNEVCPGFRVRVLGFRVRGELQAVRL